MVGIAIAFLMGNTVAYCVPNNSLCNPFVALGGLFVCVGYVLSALLLAVEEQKKRSVWGIPVAIWLIMLIVGCQHYHLRQFKPAVFTETNTSPLTQQPLKQVKLKGRLLNALKPNQWVMQVHSINNHRVKATEKTGKPLRLLLYLPKNKILSNNAGRKTSFSNHSQNLHYFPQPGQRIHCIATVSAPFETSIPGNFNQKKYLKSYQIEAIGRYVKSIEVIEPPISWHDQLLRQTIQLRNRVSGVLANTLPSPQAEIFGGLVLGERAIPVDRNTKTAFIETGLIHLLAASGMNVGIVAFSIFAICRAFKMPYQFAIVAAMIVVGFYSLLTGLPPSIQRAAVMLEIALVLKLINRSLSAVLLLCVATCFLILLNPDTIGNIGFQFSVFTTLGLLSMLPPIQKTVGFYLTNRLAAVLLVPIVAQIWILPLSVYYFNQFPLHSILLNILALVLITPLTLLGFMTACSSLLIPKLASGIASLALPFLNGLFFLVQQGSQLHWALIDMPSPSPWLIVAWYLILGGTTLAYNMPPVPVDVSNKPKEKTSKSQWFSIFSTFFKKWQKSHFILGCICIVLVSIWVERLYNSAYTWIDFLPVSPYRQAILVQQPKTQQFVGILPEDLTFYEARAFRSFLNHEGIRQLSTLVLTPQHKSRFRKNLTEQPSLISTALKPSSTGIQPVSHLAHQLVILSEKNNSAMPLYRFNALSKKMIVLKSGLHNLNMPKLNFWLYPKALQINYRQRCVFGLNVLEGKEDLLKVPQDYGLNSHQKTILTAKNCAINRLDSDSGYYLSIPHFTDFQKGYGRYRYFRLRLNENSALVFQ